MEWKGDGPEELLLTVPHLVPVLPSTIPRPYSPIKAPVRARLFPEAFQDH